MWRLLEQAAKSASANASDYVSTVQEKAQSIVASVQDEAATLLHALGTARTGPVDEILYEEIDDYKAFVATFSVEARTDAITQVLETDDEVRELHEQMVPVQLSYDEFWSRYFFRLHQEHERTRREDERRQQQAARKLELELLGDHASDLGADDDISDLALAHEDGSEGRGAESGAELELQPPGGDSSSSSSSSSDADKRAALAWKTKATELQKKLGAMAAQLTETTQRITEDKDVQYQQLCDSYEAKMAEVTLQIDDARAIGYDAGIRESEAIIAAMRQAADDEIERLKRQLSSTGDARSDRTDDSSSGTPSVFELQQALALKTQTLETVAAEKVAVETLLLAKDDELAALKAQIAQQTGHAASTLTSSSTGDRDASVDALQRANAPVAQELETANARVRALEAQLAQMSAASSSSAPTTVSSTSADDDARKRELELWRLRAVKMKKAKEHVDAEFQTFRDATEAARRTDADAFAQQLADAAAHVVALERKAEQSYAAGVDAATLAAKTEIDLLRTEIALLRASAHTNATADRTDSEAEPDVIWSVPVPVLGDEFSETDAMSHSIDNLHVAPVSDAEGGPESETSDANASVSDDPMSDAPRDDWGEW